MSKKKFHPPVTDKRHYIREKAIRFLVGFLAWLGIAVLFYVGFSFFFDTPLEYRMKRSSAAMRVQYDALLSRYDSLETVLDNVVDRDRNVFRILFESEPYDLDAGEEAERWETYEKLLGNSNRQLARELATRVAALEKEADALDASFTTLGRNLSTAGTEVDYIPAIQPVVNPDLTFLTASFGLLIHPFYKTLTPHNGVDYTIPEGSRVFATADGRVKDVRHSNTSSGLSIVISHGDNYETQYNHLSRANVARGQSVRRGDIIGLTGNTGLSLSPHLHYEVRHHGLAVDPIHYFFMELNPFDYRRIRQIARAGMQSFD
jgi:murein DD-endopeptidase MepM/ murein hydrolase activator NlpD